MQLAGDAHALGSRYVLFADAANGAPLLAADTINEFLVTHLAAADQPEAQKANSL